MRGRSSERVRIGSRVRVSGLIPGADTVLQLVPDDEVDFREHKVPTSGPLAQALMGTRAGDCVITRLVGSDVPLAVLEVDNRSR
jgi:transcription elongation GreA/GreB family factor